MNTTERLALIKARAKVKPALSVEASKTLEEIMKEDETLGVSNAYGECIAADDVEKEEKGEEGEDESELNTSLISPGMRAIQSDEARELKTAEKQFTNE